jgi:hypothetical protein
LATVVAVHPQLLVDVPTLAEPTRYTRGALLVLLAAELAAHQDGARDLRVLRQGIERHCSVVAWDRSRDGILIIVRHMFNISDATDRRRREAQS